VETISTYNEDTEIYSLIRNEKLAEDMAEQDAALFMLEIRSERFLYDMERVI